MILLVPAKVASYPELPPHQYPQSGSSQSIRPSLSSSKPLLQTSLPEGSLVSPGEQQSVYPSWVQDNSAVGPNTYILDSPVGQEALIAGPAALS